MLRTIYLLLCSCIVINSQAQPFAINQLDNHSGISAGFYNPAKFANKKYKWNFNLLSVNSSLSSNQPLFKLKNIGSNAFKLDTLFTRTLLSSEGINNGMAATDIHLPSFTINLNNKSAIALTSRSRIFATATDIDGKLVDQILSNKSLNNSFVVNSSKDMRVTINGWTELGVSYARTFIDNYKHALKAGATLKYIGGIHNSYIRLKDVNATINYDSQEEAILVNATGQINLGMSGIQLEKLTAKNIFSFKNSGWGGDIGLVYEYRNDGTQQYSKSSHAKPYQLKASIALLDVGSIKTKLDPDRSGQYSITINTNDKFYLNKLNQIALDSLNAVLTEFPNFFNLTPNQSFTTYNVSLPTNFVFEVDYPLSNKFYLNFSGLIGVNSSSWTSNKMLNTYSFVPRYEGKLLGVGIPFTYNKFSNLNLGLLLRSKGIFVGSSSLLSMLFSKSKQVDFQIGFNFGEMIFNQR